MSVKLPRGMGGAGLSGFTPTLSVIAALGVLLITERMNRRDYDAWCGCSNPHVETVMASSSLSEDPGRSNCAEGPTVAVSIRVPVTAICPLRPNVRRFPSSCMPCSVIVHAVVVCISIAIASMRSKGKVRGRFTVGWLEIRT